MLLLLFCLDWRHSDDTDEFRKIRDSFSILVLILNINRLYISETHSTHSTLTTICTILQARVASTQTCTGAGRPHDAQGSPMAHGMSFSTAYYSCIADFFGHASGQKIFESAGCYCKLLRTCLSLEIRKFEPLLRQRWCLQQDSWERHQACSLSATW